MNAQPGLWYFASCYSCKTPDGRYHLAGERALFEQFGRRVLYFQEPCEVVEVPQP